MSNPDVGTMLQEALEDSRAKDAAAARFYESLKARGQVKSHLAVTYRCPRRCTLAQILTTKAGILVHRPRYKLSPTVNAASSSEAGRAKHTEDGNRRWKAGTFMLVGDIPAQCDHLQGRAIPAARVRADVAAGHAEVTLSA